MLQRGLPRPLSLDHGPEVRGSEEAGNLSQKEAAEALLFAEMKALLQHDAAKHPVKESKKDRKVGPHRIRVLETLHACGDSVDLLMFRVVGASR